MSMHKLVQVVEISIWKKFIHRRKLNSPQDMRHKSENNTSHISFISNQHGISKPNFKFTKHWEPGAGRLGWDLNRLLFDLMLSLLFSLFSPLTACICLYSVFWIRICILMLIRLYKVTGEKTGEQNTENRQHAWDLRSVLSLLVYLVFCVLESSMLCFSSSLFSHLCSVSISRS